MTTVQPWLDAVRAKGEPTVIAEVGVNHSGSLERALDMVAEVGAVAPGHAVKFQAYRAEKLAAAHSPAYWDTTKTPETTQRALFRQFDKFTVADYEQIKVACVQSGVDFLVTAFDTELVDALDPLVPAWKVASADLTNLPYLRHIAHKGKPVILSTGAATAQETKAAIEVLRAEGAPGVVALHCVLEYPCPRDHANLWAIAGLAQAVGADAVGYSDHVPASPDMDVLTVAWLCGALVLEKHYTFDKTHPGNDHHHAMDRHDLARWLGIMRAMAPLLGTGERDTVPLHESTARQHARRSWHTTKALPAGHTLEAGDLIALRPGHGVPPTVDLVGWTLTRALGPGVAIPESVVRQPMTVAA